MELKQISADDLKRRVIEGLGLSPENVSITSPEVIAGLIRRAGSFLCPCPDRTLVNEVVDALNGLIEDVDNLRQATENMLEMLKAIGDFFEFNPADEKHSGGTLTYASPPAFVRRQSGSVILIGLAPDSSLPLPDELKDKVEYKGHTRKISFVNMDDIASHLSQLEFIEISQKAWLRLPPSESPIEFMAKIDTLLDGASASGDIPGLTLLNPLAPVSYYRGRWVDPSSQTGRFVARRKQLYGADLWCYVEVQNGVPRKLLDLPLPQSRWRGCDDAWRIQAAIDARREKPQIFKNRSGTEGSKILDFFSPVPKWAIRRWDSFGETTMGRSLFSYSFSESDFEEEANFAKDWLWLKQE